MLQLPGGGSYVKVKCLRDNVSRFCINLTSGNAQNPALIEVAVAEVEAEGEVETEDVDEVVEEEEET